MVRVVLIVVVAALFGAVSVADAATAKQANAKARRAADAYTKKSFGISGGASLWRARCRMSGGAWRCSVVMNGGQCSGSLKLSRGLARVYAVRIGCGE